MSRKKQLLKDPLEVATRCFNSCDCDFCTLVRASGADPDAAAKAFADEVTKGMAQARAEQMRVKALVQLAVAEAAMLDKEKH